MRIYLDTCCVNRPFDDQTQPEIHAEAKAVLAILDYIEVGQWEWIGSEILNGEVAHISDSVRKSRVQVFMMIITHSVSPGHNEITRAEQLQQLGFHLTDALHLACAETAQVDIFLTTDKKLLNRASRLAHEVRVKVHNPRAWFDEVTAP